MKPLGKQLVAEFIYCSTALLNDRSALEHALEQGIRESGLTLVSITGKQFYPGGVTSIALISESHVAIHTYPEAGHASIDIFTCANGSKNVTKLLQSLKSKLQPKTVRVMEVNRGNPLSLTHKNWMTSFSGTGFEVKYYIDKVLLSKQTAYQQLDIITNKNFGRMMFLDKDLQISERDAHHYNNAMVTPLIERQNAFSSVAILGGGDGGVLRETLRHKPEKAYLIEIDEEVILAAKEYMPGVCGKAFDSRKASIVLGDANEFLAQKHDFDAIIYDLTMHPESITDMERMDFLKQIFSRIRKSLKSGGMVSMQCCSEFDMETQTLLKKLLPRYFRHIVYKTVFIPSFCENWVFASAEVR
ncbi:MAG: adenosylmethionine decarboxylase [Nitrospiraceae bacterium]|nr:MAG: adenosylmethionine decarboxylase [Nitrospiraceae bacterium]UCH45878.1 MAG: adenosylmethionine decarboxylase [Nitrospiraceae bacterium]